MRKMMIHLLLALVIGFTCFVNPVVASEQSEVQWPAPKALQKNKGSAASPSKPTDQARKDSDPTNPEDLYALALTYENGEGGQKKSFKEAVRLYILAAQQGYAPAQYKAGFMHEEGNGVLPDHKEAERWYILAANQDYTLAQTSLARLYYHGHQVKQNYEAASVLSQLAANKDDRDAQVLLGKMYHYGHGFPQDYKSAAFWYKEAARLGSADGQFRFAVMLVSGQGVKKDPVAAYAWANLAAAQGHHEAEELREQVAQEFSQSRLDDAQALSQQYYKLYVEPF